jgi:hypothetical protein
VPIQASAPVPASPEEVFDFLSDLANHWRLVDRFVEVIELSGAPDHAPDSGVVRLRGPLGVHRTVRTRVTASRPPVGIDGTAEVGARTRARVSWTLSASGRDGFTQVRLEAEVLQSTLLDRLLLALGGRVWLRRRFAHGLGRLAERFAVADAAPHPTATASAAVATD